MADGSDVELLAKIAEYASTFRDDPYGFVLWAYPWGVEGGPLAKWEGPDEWQKEYLIDLTERLRSPQVSGEPIRKAVGAANGSGKSALVSWLIDWSMSTCPNTKGTVTANTANQLRTKTWSELAKWHNMSVCRPMFDLQATSLTSSIPKQQQTWRIDAVPWSKERPEAVAGLHNQGRRILLIFDEASAIDDIIWEYSDANTTDEDTEILWCVFGNTTRNSGRFKECWGRFAERWVTQRVDGRECRTTNKKLIAQWAEDYGEDSDFFRVRVKAEFPRIGDMQFFPSDWLAAARKNIIDPANVATQPAIISVDVATTGKAATVITCRRGPKLMWQRKEQYTPDTMQLAGRVLDIIRMERNVRSVCIDANGVGKGVADRLSEFLPYVVHVYGAQQANDPMQFRNLRSELFDKCRTWLRQADIPNEYFDLLQQMESIQQGTTNSMQVQVETKADMTERLGYSPDDIDSLIYSFAEDLYTPGASRASAKPLQRQKWR